MYRLLYSKTLTKPASFSTIKHISVGIQDKNNSFVPLFAHCVLILYKRHTGISNHVDQLLLLSVVKTVITVLNHVSVCQNLTKSRTILLLYFDA